MKILIATHNQSKFERYKALLSEISDIKIVSLTDLNISQKIDEPYENAKDNALHKAKEYGKISNCITIGIDESVNTNFLPKKEQPGVYVRRLRKGGKEATDEEALAFWKETIEKFDTDPKFFIWDFFVAYYDPASQKSRITHINKQDGVARKFSTTILPGYPMSSFLIVPGTNKPHSDLTEKEKYEADKQVFEPFVQDFTNWLKNL